MTFTDLGGYIFYFVQKMCPHNVSIQRKFYQIKFIIE